MEVLEGEGEGLKERVSRVEEENEAWWGASRGQNPWLQPTVVHYGPTVVAVPEIFEPFFFP